MLKKSASFVLAALRGSTYRSVRLASSLAAALLDGLLEHPAWYFPLALGVRTSEVLACLHSFSAACLSFGYVLSVERTDVLTHSRQQNTMCTSYSPRVVQRFLARIIHECRREAIETEAHGASGK
jgi:hypothetical protein